MNLSLRTARLPSRMSRADRLSKTLRQSNSENSDTLATQNSLIAAITCDRVIASCSIDAPANQIRLLVTTPSSSRRSLTTQRLPKWQIMRRFVFERRSPSTPNDFTAPKSKKRKRRSRLRFHAANPAHYELHSKKLVQTDRPEFIPIHPIDTT
jgi:hypothetical protein